MTDISTKIDYLKIQNAAKLEKLVKLEDLPNKGDKIFVKEVKNYTNKIQQLSEDDKKTLEEFKKIILSWCQNHL